MGNIKECAQLEGAFIVGGSGIMEAAGRHLTVAVSGVKVPDGPGFKSFISFRIHPHDEVRVGRRLP